MIDTQHSSMVELGSVNATVVGSSPTVLSLYHLWIILLVLDPLAQPTQSAPLVRHTGVGTYHVPKKKIFLKIRYPSLFVVIATICCWGTNRFDTTVRYTL